LVLGFGIRSGRLVFTALTTLFMGLFWTGALGLWMVGHLNIVSVAFAVLFIGLGIDFAIHFVLRYREEFYESGKREKALSGAAVAVGTPLALCAPTTALAFFAFIPTSYVGLAQLGLIAGMGMFISFLTSLTTLPAILSLMPLKKKPKERHPHAAGEAHFIERHGRAIASSGLVLGLVGLLAVPSVHFDFDPINLKSRKAESVAAFLDLMENEKTSPYVIQVLADGREAAEVKKARLETLPGVREVVGLASFVPANQEEKLEIIEGAALFMTPVFLNRGLGAPPAPADDIAEIEAFRAKAAELNAAFPDLELTRNANALSAALAGFTANDEEGAGLRALLAENLFYWFPALLDKLEAGLAAEGVSFADIPETITERFVAADGRWRLEVFPREAMAGPKHVTAFVEEVAAAAPEATGTPVQIYNSGRVVKKAMLQASLTAAFLVLAFLYLVTRSARSVGLIVLPVALAMALTAGAMWAFGIAFNFANVIVLPLLIGLGVDSGIHLVWRAEEEHGAKRVLYTSTPRAVLLSALTTLGSFGTLALSAHKGTASMGILLTI
ncbi:MAG TPA: MMPL family transporter, partial [Sphingomonadales bacterium]|nr:MMPL family transporter [Sphingomonadales bacterium]